MVFLWMHKDIASKQFWSSINAELYCGDRTVTLIEFDNAYNVINDLYNELTQLMGKFSSSLIKYPRHITLS